MVCVCQVANGLGRGVIRLLLVWGLMGLLWLGVGLPAEAADLTPLTLDVLQQRVQNPVRRDGKPTVDLRQFVIDLRSEDAGDFAEQFYRLLQVKLQSGSTPLGLDLSYGVIQGDLDLQRLGLRAPLYGPSVGDLLAPAAQEQLQRDRRRVSQLSQLSRSLLIQPETGPLKIFLFRGPLKLVQTRITGRVNGSEIFFLGRLDAQGVNFGSDSTWAEARFSQAASFMGARFQAVRFRNSIFFDRARFNQAQFGGEANFQGVEFQGATNFNQASFVQTGNFSRSQWQGSADFAQASWQQQAIFLKSRFQSELFLTGNRFEAPLLMRQAQFNQPVNLRGAAILDQADFGDARFSAGAYLNVAGLEFNADQAEILGSPGQLGAILSVPVLAGNETLLRNLVRNFRRLEQIGDANEVEYTTEKLRLRSMEQRLLGVNLNVASLPELQQVGLSASQAQTVISRRQDRPFVTVADLLGLTGVDLATYIKVRDRVVTGEPLSVLNRVQLAGRWLGLQMLLVLSRYGTRFGLALGVGLVAIALFSLMFWAIDRCRRRRPTLIWATQRETLLMVVSASGLMAVGIGAIVRTADAPGLTLACVGLLTLPIPGVLLIQLYRQGRYHDLLDESYFVEDGGLRQLRLLIARLPNIPKFPFFRDRYTPLPWDRRWNWLNYYDFSLNNWLKFGFNDIRLRDQHLPGLITSMVWYQWGLGLMYIALLLWTLSRTIPGLNLLIYF